MIPFDEKFPVHTETLTNVEDLNKILEEDIREAGDLVVMYGQRGFYGLVLERSSVVVRWNVLWQSGFIFEREESLMEVVSESR